MRFKGLVACVVPLLLSAIGCSVDNQSPQEKETLALAEKHAVPANRNEQAPKATGPKAGAFDTPRENVPSQKVPETKNRKPFTSDGPFHYLAFAPDNKTVIAGGSKWDSATGKVVSKNGFFAGSLCYSPDGALLLFGGYSGIGLWDVKREKVIWETKRRADAVTFSGDGNRFAACTNAYNNNSSKENFSVWETASKKEFRNFALPKYWRQPDSVALSPDGKYLVGHMGAVVRFWEVDTGVAVHAFPFGLGSFWPFDYPIAL